MKITSIQQQVKNKVRYSVFVDGKYAFSLSDGALLSSGLTNGLEIDSEQLAALKKMSADDKAYGNALQYVVIRPRSEWEIREYLRRKGVSEPEAQVITDKLRGFGLIDDAAFARSWVANRRLLKPTSRRKLRLELQQKHVPADVMEVVLAEDREETDEQEILRQLIERKKSRYPDKQKLIAHLARQGYSYDDIKQALNGIMG